MKLKVDQSNGTLCVCVDAAGCCVRFVGDHKREMGCSNAAKLAVDARDEPVCLAVPTLPPSSS